MMQNKKHKQTLESAQYGLEISFKKITFLTILVKHKLQGATKLTRPIKVGSDYKKLKKQV